MMLLRLSIHNYAIIDELELVFPEKLSVITGETGAGKSIVMEALGLVLGERADPAVLYDKSKKCVVEASFRVEHLDLQYFFREHDLDEADELLLRREISPSGKSRSFINDTPVNLGLMRHLSLSLVDMHQQHEARELNTAAFQLVLLDSLAKQEQRAAKYRTRFIQYQQQLNRWKTLNDEHQHGVNDLDYLRFQLDELEAASFLAGEQELLEQEQEMLQHAGDLNRQLSASVEVLSENEQSVDRKLREVLQALSGVQKYLGELQALVQRLESTRIELDDISSALQGLSEKMHPDPARLEEVDSRLDLLFRLLKKHHVPDVGSLLVLADDLRKRIQSISLQTEELDELSGEIAALKQDLVREAKELSVLRTKQVPVLVEKINAMLKEVGMPHALLRVEHAELSEEELGAHGLDRFRFLFAPNKGSEFLEIGRVASGGETSRLLLCFTSLIADTTALPTLIFDEIDTGISGETAMKVSRILKQLARQHQVICITHVPQIAAKGDKHFFVYKETFKDRTYTRVKVLNDEEKISAVARMISGEKVTPAAIESARELIH